MKGTLPLRMKIRSGLAFGLRPIVLLLALLVLPGIASAQPADKGQTISL
ncbi:MAG TPA: hypothetical protein H9879_09105 [Candidatus Alistipes intestinipullorum]|nr:hypothetical protein [Candidatus Alistipes intestinipullorum]